MSHTFQHQKQKRDQTCEMRHHFLSLLCRHGIFIYSHCSVYSTLSVHVQHNARKNWRNQVRSYPNFFDMVLRFNDFGTSAPWLVRIRTWELWTYVSIFLCPTLWSLNWIVRNFSCGYRCSPSWYEPEHYSYAWYLLTLGYFIPIFTLATTTILILIKLKKVSKSRDTHAYVLDLSSMNLCSMK